MNATEREDGGPAFPGQRDYGPGQIESWVGLSLRDYFAGEALGVMCASNVNTTGTFATPDGRAAVAAVCYLMSDAMLKERAKPYTMERKT